MRSLESMYRWKGRADPRVVLWPPHLCMYIYNEVNKRPVETAFLGMFGELRALRLSGRKCPWSHVLCT